MALSISTWSLGRKMSALSVIIVGSFNFDRISWVLSYGTFSFHWISREVNFGSLSLSLSNLGSSDFQRISWVLTFGDLHSSRGCSCLALSIFSGPHGCCLISVLWWSVSAALFFSADVVGAQYPHFRCSLDRFYGWSISAPIVINVSSFDFQFFFLCAKFRLV